MAEYSEAINALRQLGREVNFSPSLPHSIYAYHRPDLIGKQYLTHNDGYQIIQDAAEFCNPHYIFDGIALKIQNKWRFGCPVQYIKSEAQNASKQ